MSYEKRDNLYTLMKYDWTPSQFRDKMVYQSILEALVIELQRVEDLMYQIYSERSLPHAVGVQLDNLGRNMGVTRKLGQSDAEYRTAIYSEIFMRRSDGTGNYIMNALKSIYDSPTAKIFEHNTPMTGGVVAVINQPQKRPSATPVMKRMAASAIQTVAILRDPTPQGYAWTPVEVSGNTQALTTSNNDWFVTADGMGVVVQSGSGQVVRNRIGSMGDPGLQNTRLGLDSAVTPGDDVLAIDAKGATRNLEVTKETPVGGVFGVMAEVSQLRQGHSEIEGEK